MHSSRLCAACLGLGVGGLCRRAQLLPRGIPTLHNRWSPCLGISDARRPSWKTEQQFTRRCAHGWSVAFFNPTFLSSVRAFSAVVTRIDHTRLPLLHRTLCALGQPAQVRAGQDGRADNFSLVAEHLPHCDCPYPVKRGKSDTRAALSHLLQTLSTCGVTTENRADWDPLHAELSSLIATWQR